MQNITAAIGWVTIVIALSVSCGCADQLREEFYRGEIQYLHNAGNEAYQARDYPLAKESFERLLALAPGYAPAKLSLANIALAEGKAMSPRRATWRLSRKRRLGADSRTLSGVRDGTSPKSLAGERSYRERASQRSHHGPR